MLYDVGIVNEKDQKDTEREKWIRTWKFIIGMLRE